MTKEQLVIYLYGIYPNGGTTIAVATILFMATAIYFISYSDLTPLQREDKQTKYMYKIIPIKTIWAISLVVFAVGYLIPSKNVFLTMIAVPTVVESMQTGKLSKLDKILDKALDKADKFLDAKGNVNGK